MELKVNEMLSANDALGKIMALDLPAKTSYRLMRIGKKLAPELKTFEEKRMELFKKYGEPVNEGKNKGGYKLKDENLDAFNTDMSAVMSEVITLDCEPITLDMLGDVKLSTNDMFRLEKLIAEEK